MIPASETFCSIRPHATKAHHPRNPVVLPAFIGKKISYLIYQIERHGTFPFTNVEMYDLQEVHGMA
jgi:hypothetical protein